jgi:hypothetical protein
LEKGHFFLVSVHRGLVHVIASSASLLGLLLSYPSAFISPSAVATGGGSTLQEQPEMLTMF